MSAASRSVAEGGTTATWKKTRALSRTRMVTMRSTPTAILEILRVRLPAVWKPKSSIGRYRRLMGGGDRLETISTAYTGESILNIRSNIGNARRFDNFLLDFSKRFSGQCDSRTQTDYEPSRFPGIPRRHGYMNERYCVRGRRLRLRFICRVPCCVKTEHVMGLNGNSAYTSLNIVDRVTEITGTTAATTKSLKPFMNRPDNYGHPNQPMVASWRCATRSAHGTATPPGEM